MVFKILSLIFAAGLILGNVFPERASLISQARLLESELALAKGEAAYVLLDTSTGVLFLKARGVVLREWRIVRSRMWGFPFTVEAEALVKKSALLPPKREEVKPGQVGNGDTFDVKALELSDMPGAFSLILEKGIRIHVVPSSKRAERILGFARRGLKGLLLYPLNTITSALYRKTYHVLEIEVEAKVEAQALYWALESGMCFLIFPPINE